MGTRSRQAAHKCPTREGRARQGLHLAGIPARPGCQESLILCRPFLSPDPADEVSAGQDGRATGSGQAFPGKGIRDHGVETAVPGAPPASARTGSRAPGTIPLGPRHALPGGRVTSCLLLTVFPAPGEARETPDRERDLGRREPSAPREHTAALRGRRGSGLRPFCRSRLPVQRAALGHEPDHVWD